MAGNGKRGKGLGAGAAGARPRMRDVKAFQAHEILKADVSRLAAGRLAGSAHGVIPTGSRHSTGHGSAKSPERRDGSTAQLHSRVAVRGSGSLKGKKPLISS